MPIPFILGAAAIGSALYGAKKGLDAYKNKNISDEVIKNAQETHESVKTQVDKYKNIANTNFQKLGDTQTKLIYRALDKYILIVEELEIENSLDLQDILSTKTYTTIQKTQDAIATLQATLGGIVGGTIAGAMAGFGAFGAAGLLATASTGTAISALSGVAATNATLAWFGGGSLAAGGLGMAGGTAVLTGIVTGPALAVGGWFFNKKMEEKKYDAYSYLESVKALCEAMEAEGLVWKNINNKTIEKIETLEVLDTQLNSDIAKVFKTMVEKGKKVSTWLESEQMELKKMIQNAETVVNIINAPIMNDNDELTSKLKKHQEKIQELIEEIEYRWGE